MKQAAPVDQQSALAEAAAQILSQRQLHLCRACKLVVNARASSGQRSVESAVRAGRPIYSARARLARREREVCVFGPCDGLCHRPLVGPLALEPPTLRPAGDEKWRRWQRVRKLCEQLSPRSAAVLIVDDVDGVRVFLDALDNDMLRPLLDREADVRRAAALLLLHVARLARCWRAAHHNERVRLPRRCGRHGPRKLDTQVSVERSPGLWNMHCRQP
mmetsp:Transcript_41298/g.127286  ORF Transcript_41298/g.127286 Transcript_41298/m.127286 type:complete len:217 (+) Transcript_41298:1497-2147(+)